MSTLPNIFPTGKTSLFQAGEPTPVSTKSSGGDGHFDQLMKQALLPPAGKTDPSPAQNLNGAKSSAAEVPSHPKSAKAGPPVVVTKHAEVAAQPEIKSAAANPENIPAPAPVSVPVPTPIPASLVTVTELNLPAATDVSVAIGAAEISISSGAKNISTPVAPKNFRSANGQNQSVAVDPKIKTDSLEKADPTLKKNVATEIPSTTKTDSPAAKLAALTPLGEKISPVANAAEAETKTPALAIKTADDSTSEKLFSLPVTDVKNSSTPPLMADGTPTANQDTAMNNGDKASKSASLAGKFLPGSVAVVTRGNDFAPRSDQSSASVAIDSASPNASATATQSMSEPAAISSVDDLRSQALERTHDLVALHALRLSEVGNDSLQVVIKPGAGTQLSLELRQRGDGIEAQVALQQGDFKHLNQLWPELQQRLEQRGIRLAPLTDDVAAGGNRGGGETFGQKQNQPVAAVAELVVPVRGTFAPPAARTAAHLGWETWA